MRSFLEEQFLSFENSEKLRLRGSSLEAEVPVDDVEEHEDGGEDDDAGVVDLGQAAPLPLLQGGDSTAFGKIHTEAHQKCH